MSSDEITVAKRVPNAESTVAQRQSASKSGSTGTLPMPTNMLFYGTQKSIEALVEVAKVLYLDGVANTYEDEGWATARFSALRKLVEASRITDTHLDQLYSTIAHELLPLGSHREELPSGVEGLTFNTDKATGETQTFVLDEGQKAFVLKTLAAGVTAPGVGRYQGETTILIPLLPDGAESDWDPYAREIKRWDSGASALTRALHKSAVKLSAYLANAI